ncbi:hypothetical protein PVAP13_5KG186421 [Panicum virgatum]|uniref:Uncharacterized protein n=1 Tax=Panicum virgatum TaxID=38727 RepID=A0A8T0SIB4_PANVG|nr:hypothetical protein PVAP13_5KG186421 [Panicum virgatum]
MVTGGGWSDFGRGEAGLGVGEGGGGAGEAAPPHLPVVPSSRKPFLVHRPVIKEQTYRDEVPFMEHCRAPAGHEELAASRPFS